jgi:hypothetical protein
VTDNIAIVKRPGYLKPKPRPVDMLSVTIDLAARL